jgi:SEC-C motif-containing protein
MAEPTWPTTAEALMRSRFAAFTVGDVAWLLATWHPSTRPEELDLDPGQRWRGLQVVDTVAGGENDAEGIVEFRATCAVDGQMYVLQERSRFVRHGGRWVYLEAVAAPTYERLTP